MKVDSKAQLPEELWHHVLREADLSPESLTKAATQLSKKPNPLSAAACSPQLWKKWQPEAVYNAALTHPQADYCVREFISRCRAYPDSARSTAKYVRGRLYEPLPFVFKDYGGNEMHNWHLSNLNAQMLEEGRPYNWLQYSVFEPAPSQQAFDTALALIDYKPNIFASTWQSLPSFLWDEWAFVSRVVQIDNAPTALISARLKKTFGLNA